MRATGSHRRQEAAALWPLALVALCLVAVRPTVAPPPQAPGVPAVKAADAHVFDEARKAALAAQAPEVVVIGNSMAFSRIDPALLSAISGRRVALIGMPNSGAVHWYLALQNLVATLPRPPETVFIFFQDTQLLEVTANEPALRERLAQATEPALEALQRRQCASWDEQLAVPARAVLQRVVPVVGVERRTWVPDLADWILQVVDDDGRDPHETHLAWNEIFALGALRSRTNHLEQGSTLTSRGIEDVERRWSCSLLPAMQTVQRDVGFRLVFIRVQNRPRPGQGPDETPALRVSVAALRAHLEAEGLGFHDFTNDPEITLEKYSYGSHIADDARPWFTAHFFQTTKRFWVP